MNSYLNVSVLTAFMEINSFNPHNKRLTYITLILYNRFLMSIEENSLCKNTFVN